jgi:tRNA nucleotidyltransferase (CCA-adding enzyme)
LFAERLKDQSKGEVTKVVLLEANPEQAKHLETARVRLFSDFWVDICGLRPDDVSAASSGTPSQDAHCRDLTMNAIFFNLNHGSIEDFTGGIQDLRRGILMTPLDPRVTFTDDPLRILRVFRFAARTEFVLDGALIPAARLLVADFRAKITRERITAEFVKSMDGCHPEEVIRNICDAGLLNNVFDPDMELSLNESEVIGRVEVASSRGIRDHRLEIVLAAIFAPWGGKTMTDRHRNASVVEVQLMRKLRYPRHVSDRVVTLLNGCQAFGYLRSPLERVGLGRWVKMVGELYYLVHYVLFDDEQHDFCVNEVYPAVMEKGLVGVWNMKPIVKGRELAELHGIEPGRDLKVKISELIDWQLEHPVGTADDYRAFVQSRDQ